MRTILLFDVMDTLVYNPFNAEIPQFFNLRQDELLEQKHPSAWVQFELGEIDQDQYLKSYFDDRRNFDHDRFLSVVKEAYRWIDGAENLIRELNELGFQIHALSNYPIWYRTIESKLGLSRYLNWTFVSCLTGVRKPAPAAYLGAAKQLDHPVERCLLVDDSTVNCDAANALGMPAIRFRNAVDLRAELLKKGLFY